MKKNMPPPSPVPLKGWSGRETSAPRSYLVCVFQKSGPSAADQTVDEEDGAAKIPRNSGQRSNAQPSSIPVPRRRSGLVAAINAVVW